MSTLILHKLFVNEMILLGYEIFVRARLIKIKKSSLQCKFIKHKIVLQWRNNDGLSNTSQEWRCTFELADLHQCNKVDFHFCCFVCLFLTSFHSFSTATFASGINIARGERSFAHTLGFPRQASLRDRSPELSEPFCTFHLCIHPHYLCVHLRLAEQNNIRSLYFFSSQVHTWECLVLPGL